MKKGDTIFYGFCIGFPIDFFKTDITKNIVFKIHNLQKLQWEIPYKIHKNSDPFFHEIVPTSKSSFSKTTGRIYFKFVL